MTCFILNQEVHYNFEDQELHSNSGSSSSDEEILPAKTLDYHLLDEVHAGLAKVADQAWCTQAASQLGVGSGPHVGFRGGLLELRARCGSQVRRSSWQRRICCWASASHPEGGNFTPTPNAKARIFRALGCQSIWAVGACIPQPCRSQLSLLPREHILF